MDMKEYVPEFNMEKLKTVLKIKRQVDRGELTLQEGQEILLKEIGRLKPYEVALAEQELREFEKDQCQKEDIQGMTDLFFGIMDTSRPELPREHPIDKYYRENDEMKKLLAAIEDLVQYPVIKNQWYELYDKLAEYTTHLSRKQNQLYSVLEQKGFDRPTTTMWTLDNFIRDEIKEIRKLLDTDEEKFIEMQDVLRKDLEDLMDKEEKILYPTALSMISPEEFEEMKEGDREIGFAYLEPAEEAPKKKSEKKGNGDSFVEELQDLLAKYGLGTSTGELDVAQGSLTLDQINLIYRHLPVDLSYVDENELVRFYSDTEHRVFPRSKNVIGRNVKNCHPRDSVHIVEEIIEKFRSGEEDHAEFWINKPDLFIYIYYTAVRDEEGNFRGVLEMMQDCTRIRSLEGSRTLLTWDEEEESGKEEIGGSASSEEPKEEKELLPLTSKSRPEPLLKAYPKLKEELPGISSAFKMMTTPLGRVMIPKATVGMMAERSGMEEEELISALEKKIREYEG